jgi:DNA-binding response OmpR family regulator
MAGEQAGRILVIAADRDTAAVIRTALESRGYQVRLAYDGLAGVAASRAESFDLIVVDGALPGMGAVEVVEQLRREPKAADTPIIVLAEQQDNLFRVRLFELGVDHCLSKPVSPLELINRVQSLLRQAAERPSPSPGKVVSFVGCAGGVGTTTVCVNVAQALASRFSCILLDLGWPLGAVHHQLASPGAPGLDVLVSKDTATTTLVSLLVGGRAGVRFRYLNGLTELPFLRTGLGEEWCRGEKWEALLASCREQAAFVLVDLGCGAAPFAPAVLAASDLVVLVLALERTHIQLARSYLSALDEIGVRRSRRLLVANRLRSSPLGLRAVERGLQAEIFTVIPNESGRLAQCLDEGRILLNQYPESAGAISLAELASAINRQVTVDA